MSSLFFAFSKRQIKTASYKPASYRMKIKPLLKDIGRKKPAVGEGGAFFALPTPSQFTPATQAQHNAK